MISLNTVFDDILLIQIGAPQISAKSATILSHSDQVHQRGGRVQLPGRGPQET